MTHPFADRKNFYSRGKNKAHSHVWQCKTCGKYTNVLPSRRETVTYHQQRNKIMPLFIKILLGRTPVRRACATLKISPDTYYGKMEWLYKRCLEFLERHETEPLSKIKFKTIYLDTDQMIYNLNNVRMRGKSDGKYGNLEDKFVNTHVIVSGDNETRYVFRADVCYDWDIRLEDIEQDTVTYHDDHLHEFARKYARLRMSYAPQSPTELDSQSERDYEKELRKFNRRKQYVPGIQTDSTYTAIAHYWHIKQKVKAEHWRFISDDDGGLIKSLYRVYAKEINDGFAHHFLCQVHKIALDESHREHSLARRDLLYWGSDKGHRVISKKLAEEKLANYLQEHDLYEFVEVDGRQYPVKPKPVAHPLPHRDEGVRLISSTTDLLRNYKPHEIAQIMLRVNQTATNKFIQAIRRHILTLERPITTARPGRGFIYSNFNPKYAHWALTILRTYYNFCSPWTTKKYIHLTPAQRMGLTDRVFTMDDIIYFR